MKVGVLGSGDVAKALAGGFVKHAHDVMIGTRTPAEPLRVHQWGHTLSSRVTVGLRPGRGTASHRA